MPGPTPRDMADYEANTRKLIKEGYYTKTRSGGLTYSGKPKRKKKRPKRRM